jgi:hypothetical protein
MNKPKKLFVYITFWQKPKSKKRYLHRTLLNLYHWLKEIIFVVGIPKMSSPIIFIIRELYRINVDQIVIHIITNEDLSFDRDFCNRLETVPESASIIVHKKNVDEFENNFELTWVHKEIFKRDFLDSSNVHDNYFLYLEHDQLFTNHNFQYYLAHRDILRESALLPGFLRVELDSYNFKWCLTDEVNNLTKKSIIGEFQNFVGIKATNPYTGFYIMDAEEAGIHFKSKFSTLREATTEKPNFGISELAALGNTFCDSDGNSAKDSSRSVLLFNKINTRIVTGSLVWHLSNRYADNQIARNFRKFGALTLEKYENSISKNQD